MLFVARRPPRSPRVVVVADDLRGCPQPACNHPSHGGIPVPRKFCGTSRFRGMLVAHFRCSLDSRHHVAFVRVGNRWERLVS